jgi:hypothetical protein
MDSESAFWPNHDNDRTLTSEFFKDLPHAVVPLFLPADQFDRSTSVASAKISKSHGKLDIEARSPPTLSRRGCSNALPALHLPGKPLWHLAYHRAIRVQRHQSGQPQFRAFFHNQIHFCALGQSLSQDAWLGGKPDGTQPRDPLSLDLRSANTRQAYQALLTGAIKGSNFISNP